MGGKGSGRHSKYLIPKDPEKAMQLSEDVVLKVLGGKTRLIKDSSEYTRAKYAFQLYLRRVPAMTEEVGNVAAKTIINMITNHVPKDSIERQPGTRTDSSRVGVQPQTDSSS